jgi:hypothetical protein
MDENFDFIKGVLEHALHPSEHGGEESLSRPLCTPPKPHQQQEYRKQVQMV